MTSLRQRAYRLIIQDLAIIGLDFEFHVERSLKPEQNTAEFLVYNLSADHRAHLQEIAGGVVVELRAGYEGSEPTRPGINSGAPAPPAEIPRIFLGKLREVTTLRNGADWETRVTSGDGDGKDKPVNFSLGPGASLKTAIERTVKDLGLGIGNAGQALLGKGFGAGLGSVFSTGVTVAGRGDHELERLTRAAGLEMSVQGGELQLLEKGKALNTPAVEVSEATGLVGSPEIGEKGSVKFRTFLNADIYPGRQVRVRAVQVDGCFRVETASYIGQWSGNDWYVDVEAKVVKT